MSLVHVPAYVKVDGTHVGAYTYTTGHSIERRDQYNDLLKAGHEVKIGRLGAHHPYEGRLGTVTGFRGSGTARRVRVRMHADANGRGGGFDLYPKPGDVARTRREAAFPGSQERAMGIPEPGRVSVHNLIGSIPADHATHLPNGTEVSYGIGGWRVDGRGPISDHATATGHAMRAEEVRAGLNDNPHASPRDVIVGTPIAERSQFFPRVTDTGQGTTSPNHVEQLERDRALEESQTAHRQAAQTADELRARLGAQTNQSTGGPTSPARSPAGRIRNVHAMSDEKLERLVGEMEGSPDQDALDAVNNEAEARELRPTESRRLSNESARQSAVRPGLEDFNALMGGGAEGQQAMEEGFSARREAQRDRPALGGR